VDAVAVGGWSIQYAGATGTSWSVTPLPVVDVPGGGYLLIAEASGGGAGGALPPADQTGTINLGGASGKVALVAGTAPLSGACPAGPAVLDLVGYGDATCSETRPADAPGAAQPIARVNDGCTDSDQNAADFAATDGAPFTSASPPRVCECAN
jgi:hypothetical protein